jgi:hypothetical protein
MANERMVETEAWLVLEPSFSKRGGELVATSMRITGVRKNRPESTRDPVVKLKLRIPARAFAPLAPVVTIEVPEDLLVIPEPEVTVEVPEPPS